MSTNHKSRLHIPTKGIRQGVVGGRQDIRGVADVGLGEGGDLGVGLVRRDDELESLSLRDVQPGALVVIGRHYVTERDSAPVQYNGAV